MAILNMVGVDKLCSIMAIDDEEIALAACNLFQCINDSLTGGDKREYGKEEALVLGETEKYCISHLLITYFDISYPFYSCRKTKGCSYAHIGLFIMDTIMYFVPSQMHLKTLKRFFSLCWRWSRVRRCLAMAEIKL